MTHVSVLKIPAAVVVRWATALAGAPVMSDSHVIVMLTLPVPQNRCHHLAVAVPVPTCSSSLGTGVMGLAGLLTWWAINQPVGSWVTPVEGSSAPYWVVLSMLP